MSILVTVLVFIEGFVRLYFYSNENHDVLWDMTPYSLLDTLV